MMKRYILAYVENKSLDKLDEATMTRLTHVNLAFGVIRSGKLSLQDLPDLKKIEPLRQKYPDVRWILSIGGWTADGFSQAAWDADTRKTFADSVAEAVKAYQLDGVDIDWEFPCNDVGGIAAHPNDKQNFTLLLAALREAIGEGKSLSVAVGAEAWFIPNTEMDKVAQIVDFVQVMTYDLRPSHKTTGHHTAPYEPKDKLRDNCMLHAVERFVQAGVPAEKIVVGAAFYGRHWRGGNAGKGLHCQAETFADYGPAYHDIVKLKENAAYRFCWDEDACAPYVLGPDIFISYDDPRSVAEKCRVIRERGLLGIMYWVHGFDDTGILLRTMAEELTKDGK